MSIKETVLRDYVNRLIRQESGLLQVLWETIGRIEAGFYSRCWVDAVVQKRDSDPFNIYDAWCFLDVHARLLLGEIMTCGVHVGYGPGPDAARQVNDAALQHLPAPFHGEFWGGPGDSDGFIQWDKPVMLGQTLHDGIEKRVTVPAFRLPLEVGYTQGATTLVHLQLAGGVARWAYDDPFVWLLYNTAVLPVDDCNEECQ